MPSRLVKEFEKCVQFANWTYDELIDEQKYDQTIIGALSGIHKALTYEGYEEPEYPSIIEREYWAHDLGCEVLSEVTRLCYDHNGILRKTIKGHREILTFGPERIPDEHCLLSIELFSEQGEPFRKCHYAIKHGYLVQPETGYTHKTREDCVTIVRKTHRSGSVEQEFFHISDDNLFSEPFPPAPVQVIPCALWEVGDQCRTMEWWCDPKNNDECYYPRIRGRKYFAISSAPQYRERLWVSDEPADW